MITTKITTDGKWLRSDAAASWERMRAAGMPAGGLVSAGRTKAQQMALWLSYRAGRGNLAAFPGPRAFHMLGVAVDVSRGSAAQVWLCHGGDPWKITSTGSILANEYGWFRTVAGEPWHFQYFPERDRHRGAQPTPAKQDLSSASLLLGIANDESYSGDNSEKAWRARGRLKAAQKRNVWVVTETTPKGRGWMLEELSKASGHTWKTITLKNKIVAVLFDSSVFSWRAWRSVGPWTPLGHGTLKVPLWFKGAGVGVDILSHHTPPSSVATDTMKDRYIRLGAALAGKWSAVLAGDFARNSPTLPGWKRVTAKVDSMDKPGEQDVDAAFTLGFLWASNAKMIDPERLSDHKWFTVDIAFVDPTL